MPQVISDAEYRRLSREAVILSSSGEPEEVQEWAQQRMHQESETLSPEQLDRLQRSVYNVEPSVFVEFAFRIPDKKKKLRPFSFEGRPYLRQIYDTPAKNLLLRSSRQSEKSTLLGNRSIAYACLIPSFNVLYVSPANAQTKKFSNDRIREPIETSDVLGSWVSKYDDNVFFKKFINRSQIDLRYAYHNADRVRGIPADMILIDEIQDVLTDNIPVIEQCASHSPYKLFVYSGTPKTFSNAIEKYWADQSTQNEWVVPCHRHSYMVGGHLVKAHWNVLGEQSIGTSGTVCEKCGERIFSDDPESRWVSMNPGIVSRLSNPYEGFHVSRLMVPWLDWGELLDNYKTYPPHKFGNEVLGISVDTGSRPLTREDLIQNCWKTDLGGIPITMEPNDLTALRRSFGGTIRPYMGIDWGSSENKSFTVISLGAVINGFFTIFYLYRCIGRDAEPPEQVRIISELINAWNVDLIGSDYGGGFDRNYDLKKRFGQRVVKYQYLNPNKKLRWQGELDRFIVNRTEVMSDVFNAIKSRRIFRFPQWEKFETPFGEDMLNIFSEYNEQRYQITYDKPKDVSDDSFHSVLYCMLAYILKNPRPDILRPDDSVNGDETDGRRDLG
jgi:hypothetical protein